MFYVYTSTHIFASICSWWEFYASQFEILSMSDPAHLGLCSPVFKTPLSISANFKPPVITGPVIWHSHDHYKGGTSSGGVSSPLPSSGPLASPTVCPDTDPQRLLCPSSSIMIDVLTSSVFASLKGLVTQRSPLDPPGSSFGPAFSYCEKPAY